MVTKSLLTLLAFLSLASSASAQELLIERSTLPRFGSNKPETVVPGARSLGNFSTRSGRGERRVIEKVELPSGSDVDKAVEALRNEPGVLSVEINQKFHKFDTSNDQLYTNGSLWGMYSSDSPVAGPTGTTNSFGSQAEQGWRLGNTGSMRTVVGVIDTGIDHTHPDLYLNIYLNQAEIPTATRSLLVDTDSDGVITFRDLNNASNSSRVSDLNSNGRIDLGDLLQDSRWENGVDEDNNGFTDDLSGWDFVNGDNDAMDDDGHGTHVAGTIGGMGGNSIGVAGAAWKVQMMPIKFLDETGSGYLSDAILAIDYFTSATSAQDKAYNPSSPLLFLGTNNSWGGGGYSSLLRTSIVNGGLVNNNFVAAAGNASSDTDTYPSYPSAYTTLPNTSWEVITSVAALNSNGTLAWFSNYGRQSVDIGAPGAGIQSAAPGGGYQSLSGTSMAAPHVMGAMALYASTFPALARSSYRATLLSTSVETPSLNLKTVTNGRLDILKMFVPSTSNYLWGTTGNDRIVGTTSSDFISGTPSTGTTPPQLGKGQIDQALGGLGSDTFMVGQYRSSTPHVFYNNGVTSAVGSNDYLNIVDFNRSLDKIGFVPGRYFTRNSSTNTIIYWDRNNNGILNLTGPNRDEMIALVQRANLGNLAITSSSLPSWATFFSP